MKFARFLLAAVLLIGLPAFADPITYTAFLSGPSEFPRTVECRGRGSGVRR